MPDGGGASRSTDPAAGSSTGTDVSLREYLEARLADRSELARGLRAADKELAAERDRRYTELAAERERALAIKEQGDRTALELAKRIQDHKDEKANDLRSQIERERGMYATQHDLGAIAEKFDLAMKPVVDYVSSQQGRQAGIGLSAGVFVGALSAVGAVLGVVIVLANLFTG